MVHVDLDGASNIYKARGWKYGLKTDPLFVSGMKNLLTFLSNNQIIATLFTIASDVEDPQKLDFLREAVRQGHEIASHSLTHANLRKLSFEQKRKEIAESKEKLQQHLSANVTGFRAPSYLVDRDILELLETYDYRYDSSVFPTLDSAKKLQLPIIREYPYQPVFGSPIYEIPLPGYKPALFPFHPSYSLVVGDWYFTSGLKRAKMTRYPFVLLFHLTDFSDPLPNQHLNGFLSRLYTLSHIPSSRKIEKCQKMTDLVKCDYRMTDTSSFLDYLNESSPGKEPIVMSISTTHETGTSIFNGRDLLAAISEERLDRVKFSTKYPPKLSIAEAINVSGVSPQDIDEVIVSGLPPRRLFPVLSRGQLKDMMEFHGWIDYFPHFCKLLYRLFSYYRSLGYHSILSHLKKEFNITPSIQFVEHHQCHASCAYRTAPFDNALIVTADGVGDDVSLTISKGTKGRIQRLAEINYPHSFGQFYTACTQVLGFRANRHEGKITGLSGFGRVDPALYQEVKSTIRKSGPDFSLDKRYYSEGIIRAFSLAKIRKGEDLFDALQYRNYKTPLKTLLSGYPREDVAAAYQTILEEEVVNVIRPYAQETKLKNLALAGGLFANVKLNERLFRALDMEQVYIFPHMGDGGLSVGAALEFLQAPPKPFDSVFWGPEYAEEEMENALRASDSKGLEYRRKTNIEKEIAKLLVNDKVVGRFDGRMEFGPRALCNRSILYNASDAETNDWLNKRLGRTEFMPFAPVALLEKAELLFEDIQGMEHACKFMTIIVSCTEFTKKKCPAIVHVDGTARPQLVTSDVNPSIYKVLSYYESMTGIPLLVNTSFNMHEEPIVCTPQDAVRAFLTSRLDYLAMGPFLAWLRT
jgi:carbamoyltransferase